MTEPQQTKPSILRRGWGLLQWAVSIFALLLAALIVAVNQGFGVPGAPVTGLFISLGVFALLAVSLSPPLFFRMPKLAKIGSYVGLFIAFITLVNFNGMVLDAYKQTPKGAREAAERVAQDKIERAEQTQAEQKAVQDQAALEGAKQALADLKDLSERLEACKSWGEVPALSKLVQESMNNPDSFEHVSTEFIVPTDQGQNVVMKFRGTNKFGGVVTTQVLARVEADTCNVSDVSQPE